MAANESRLTPKQLQIAKLIIKGKSNQEIADALFIDVRTVKCHNTVIFKKTKSRNRVGLILKGDWVLARNS